MHERLHQNKLFCHRILVRNKYYVMFFLDCMTIITPNAGSTSSQVGTDRRAHS